MGEAKPGVVLGVMVNEAYRGWSAPSWLHEVTCGLLEAVDPRHLRGLRAVVLTNHLALTGERKRAKVWWRSRKVRIVDSLGLYHHATPRQGAWIELMADGVVAGAPQWAWSFSIIRDGLLAHTLYHEVGHHIHDFGRCSSSCSSSTMCLTFSGFFSSPPCFCTGHGSSRGSD